MKRKKRAHNGLLFILIVSFLAVVWFAATTTEDAERRVWSTKVQVRQPQALPEIKRNAYPVEGVSTLAQQPLAESLPNPEISQQTVAMNVLRSLPRPAPQPAIPYSPIERPRIAIVIDDMGLNIANSEGAIALPAPLTLSFLPYGIRLADLTSRAVRAGHDVMLHVPMEPLGSKNPGHGALYIGHSPEEIRSRIEKALGSFSGFSGVNNHMGSKFTADRVGMMLLMEVLKERELFFLDSYTTSKSVGKEVAYDFGVPFLVRDVFLDDKATLDNVMAQLAETERIARRKGAAIAIGHPYPVTLAALKRWLPEAERSGFVIVPVKDLLE